LDREAGIVRNVKILGWTSLNRRRYTRAAVEKAVPLYDGCKVYINHSKTAPNSTAVPERDLRDRFGRILNPRVEETGLYGDLRYNPNHTWAKAFEWFAENDPEGLGLSHEALLRQVRTEDGAEIIEIPKVYSVDLVATPGSVNSLFEEHVMDKEPELPEMEAPDTTPEASGDFEEHLAAACTAVIKDKKMTPAQRKKKIAAILKLLDSGSEAEEPAAAADAKESEIQELRLKLDEFIARESLQRDQTDATAACKKAGLPDRLITEVFINTMVSRGRESWDQLIADRRTLVAGISPESTGVSREHLTKDTLVKMLYGGK
jgi:hypothetical protein